MKRQNEIYLDNINYSPLTMKANLHNYYKLKLKLEKRLAEYLKVKRTDI